MADIFKPHPSLWSIMIKEKSKLWHLASASMGKFLAHYSPLPAGFYTLMTLFFALLALPLAYFHYFITAISLFFIASILDSIDGAVARARNKASNFGAFIDGTTDRFVDFAIIFSYFFFDITPIWLDINQLICITSFVVIMPSFIVSYANHRGAVEDDNEVLIWRVMNRAEMIFIMLGILIFSLIDPVWAGYLLLLLILLATVTILQTILETLYYSRKNSQRSIEISSS